MKKTLKKELLVTMKVNIKRFLSLIAIIFLGVGFYVGMKLNAPVLKDTMANMFKNSNYMDIQIVSTVGLTKKEMKSLKNKIPEIKDIELGYHKDAIVNINNKKLVFAVNSYDDSAKLNRIEIVEGNMAYTNNECVADYQLFLDGYKIGDTIYVNLDELKVKKLKIVGFARSPLYISLEKGTSNLMSGKIDYFLYVPYENFNYDEDVYSVAYVKLKKNYDPFSEKYSDYTENLKNKISKVSKQISKDRIEKIIKDKTNELNEAEKTYNEEKEKQLANLSDAKKELDNADYEIRSAEGKLMTDKEVDLYLANLKISLDNAKAQLDSSYQMIQLAKKVLQDIESSEISSASNLDMSYLKGKLSDANKLLSTLNSGLEKLHKDLKDNQEKCNKIENGTLKNVCNDASDSIQKSIDEENKKVLQVKSEIEQIQRLIIFMENYDGINVEEYKAYVSGLESDYAKGKKSYDEALKQYNNARLTMKGSMANARETLTLKKQEFETAKETYNATEKQVLEAFEKEEEKIVEARKLLDSLKDAYWYVFTREDNYGYSQYYSDIKKLDNLSKLLPILFFLVAALVTATSISRMANEERSKIGILKSLGYNEKQIIYKYLYYTYFAALIGIILGTITGYLVFPRIFSKVYSILYYIPKLKLSIYVKNILIAIILSFLSTILVGYITVKKSLKEEPSDLMRPKKDDVKSLKLIEMMQKVLKKLPFTKRITYRNIIKSIKRSIMTIIGVAGCTALIVASFGTRDSIMNILSLQYNKIFNISSQFFFNDEISQYEMSNERENINNLDGVESVGLNRLEVVYVKNKNKKTSVNLTVPNDINDFEKQINLIDNKNKKVSLDNNGAVITQKLAKLSNVKVGDYIEFTDSDNFTKRVRVTKIVENYIYHYIYITKDTYEKLYKKEPKYNMLTIRYKDVNSNKMNSIVFERGNYSSYLSLNNAKESFDLVMERFNIVLIVIIISAGLLAFVVLYNLSKINISERQREVATLKVLGFRAKEVNKFINEEKRTLTIIGIILGLIMGYYLTEIVITTCELDTIMFYHGISIVSYIYAVILTIIFSSVIDRLVKKDLKNINMTESLKSVE